jgi:hypothetical protein
MWPALAVASVGLAAARRGRVALNRARGIIEAIVSRWCGTREVEDEVMHHVMIVVRRRIILGLGTPWPCGAPDFHYTFPIHNHLLDRQA